MDRPVREENFLVKQFMGSYPQDQCTTGMCGGSVQYKLATHVCLALTVVGLLTAPLERTFEFIPIPAMRPYKLFTERHIKENWRWERDKLETL